jgi:glycosyltransferase involved in cell wall biosynthesis
MNIVLFAHPDFLGSQSMSRFAASLATAFVERGHHVSLRMPRARLRQLLSHGRVAKWAGYVDQYMIFPREIKTAIARDSIDTLYVFCDQALGPWVPYVAHRPHVVHCHDLLALRSALGLIPENPTGTTGRIYQRYIRAGFRRARHFISVSKQTRVELHEFGGIEPVTSEVVYNGMNFPHAPMAPNHAAALLASSGLDVPPQGMLLHVGGGQWYKNTVGLLEMYAEYASQERQPLPLWIVSPPPDAASASIIGTLPAVAQVRFIHGIESTALQAAYSLARAFLFPSLAEGFGWPIAEALACGCPVITTDAAPMTEVGGPAAYYLPRRPGGAGSSQWALHAAQLLGEVLREAPELRTARRARGLEWVRRFDAGEAIDRYLAIYETVLGLESQSAGAAAARGATS